MVRDQLAEDFATLMLLRRARALESQPELPRVKNATSRLKSAGDWEELDQLYPSGQRRRKQGRTRLRMETRNVVIVALRHKKFLRKGRDRAAEATEMLMAPAVELPIERRVAGPSLLADTIVRRWQDHQPLSRREDIHEREKLGLPKSTICSWHEYLAELVRPVVDAMFQDAYREPYLCMDATGVLVLAK